MEKYSFFDQGYSSRSRSQRNFFRESEVENICQNQNRKKEGNNA